MLCLGEGSTRARLNCLDLHCSFKALINAEYGGQNHLDFAAQNYVENVKREETGIAGITYEQALRNLVVAMYGHYVDLFHCHTATSRPSNGTHVQLSGSGHQVGSLPPSHPEAPTRGGVARLDPYTRGSGWGSPT